MSDVMYRAMVEATRLTQEGRLAEATALIQRHLGGTGVPTTSAPPPGGDPVVIDTTCRISEAPTSASGEPAMALEAPENVVKPAVEPERAAPAAAGSPRVRRLRGGAGRAVAMPRDTFRKDLPRPGRERLRRTLPRDAVAPAAGRWLEGTHSDRAGARAYRLYIPDAYRGQPLPLIVMLHGCTQNPDDFAAGTRMNFLAETAGIVVVYPEQSGSANASKCWNWFQPGDQGRGQGEPAILAGLTRRVMEEYHADPRRVYVAGMSAGGAMAAILATTYPDLYAAVGVHSGLAPRCAHDLPSAYQAMQGGGQAVASGTGCSVPLILFHGDSDRTVRPRNADQLVEQWTGSGRASGPAGQRAGTAGGRSYTCAAYTDARGRTLVERWTIHGAGHAWSGGSPSGSYADPNGPDASHEFLRFFSTHRS